MGKENQTWYCISRKIVSASYTKLVSQIEYEIPGPGVYAVIFRPDLVDPFYIGRDEQGCWKLLWFRLQVQSSYLGLHHHRDSFHSLGFPVGQWPVIFVD